VAGGQGPPDLNGLMKQVTQRLRNGRIEVLDVPAPSLQPTGVLVDVRSSLLSAGTERSKVETGRQSLLGKARSRPDQVRQVVEKAQRDGIRDTVAAVRTRLDQPEALGYSAAGVVVAAGARVRDLATGDRVACAGAGYAVHADFDYVPGNLCVRLPDTVNFDQGAFATVGSIALHGVRQAGVQLGERVAVVGLGLVGQLTGQLLKAAGCHVIGFDLSDELIRVGLETAAIDQGAVPPQAGDDETMGAGACDAVIVTAATRSDDPVTLAAQLCRDRGRIVVVGDVGMKLPRAPYYERELSLRMSRSYGPGRYDREYEERGLDYPIGYVRWTERRNMEAFVELVAQGKIDVSALVRKRVPVDEAPAAYDQLVDSDESSLGILIQYPAASPDMAFDHGASVAKAVGRADASPDGTDAVPSPLSVGVIGAGSFASRVLIPALEKAEFSLTAVASATGLSARAAASRFGFERFDTPAGVLDDPDIGLAVIATRHSSHAELTERALNASKAVFVEKPPCLTVAELVRLREVRAGSAAPLFVGFNRRHAPLAKRMQEYFTQPATPMTLLYRVSVGTVDSDHWLDDPEEGGGRLVGEGCHFIDFASWLIGGWPSAVTCSVDPSAQSISSAKTFTVTLTYPNGSIASILYMAGGASGVRKEYVEVHGGGRSAKLDDFRALTLIAGRRRKRVRGRGQDKGHYHQLRRMRDILTGDGEPAADDPLDSMALTFAAVQAAEEARTIPPQQSGAANGVTATG